MSTGRELAIQIMMKWLPLTDVLHEIRKLNQWFLLTNIHQESIMIFITFSLLQIKHFCQIQMAHPVFWDAFFQFFSSLRNFHFSRKPPTASISVVTIVYAFSEIQNTGCVYCTAKINSFTIFANWYIICTYRNSYTVLKHCITVMNNKRLEHPV